MLRLYFFFNRSHWYLAVICFPWLEEVVYEDFPQTIPQHSQAEESHHDSRTIGDKLNVDHIFNNDGKVKMIIENNMRLKGSINSIIIFYHLVY